MVNKTEYKDLEKRLEKLSPIALDDVIAKNESGTQLLMPVVVALMKSDLTKVQLRVIQTLIRHIGNVIKKALNNSNKNIMMLFAEEEMSGDNSNDVKMQLYYKDFGVSTANYSKLQKAIELMSSVRVFFPKKGKSGIEYDVYTHFFSRIAFPKDIKYNKYCIVSMNKDVSERIVDMDFGYMYIDEITSNKLNAHETKLYWYIQGRKFKDYISIPYEDFRGILGAANKYSDHDKFVKKVLDPAIEKIKELFLSGESDCYVTYQFKYNSSAKKIPTDVVLNFIKKKESDTNIDCQLLIDDTEKSILFKKYLIEDLKLSEYMASGISQNVNAGNFNEAYHKLLYIKEFLDNSNKNGVTIKNKTFYVLQCFSQFFKTLNQNNNESKENPKSKEKKETVMEAIDKHVLPSSKENLILPNENADKWQQLLYEYDGSLKTILVNAEYIGMHNGKFRIEVTEEQKKIFHNNRSEMEKFNRLGRRILGIAEDSLRPIIEY